MWPGSDWAPEESYLLQACQPVIPYCEEESAQVATGKIQMPKDALCSLLFMLDTVKIESLPTRWPILYVLSMCA